ncbi:hypothetical protein R6G00_00110, partial [Streptomyces roseofulvus]
FDDEYASVAPENAPPTLFFTADDNVVVLPTATEPGGFVNDTDPNNGAGIFAGADVGARVMSRYGTRLDSRAEVKMITASVVTLSWVSANDIVPVDADASCATYPVRSAVDHAAVRSTRILPTVAPICGRF